MLEKIAWSRIRLVYDRLAVLLYLTLRSPDPVRYFCGYEKESRCEPALFLVVSCSLD